MSHYKNAALTTALSALFLSASAFPVTANAAIYTPEARTTVYKTSLSSVEGLDERVLDWRNPTIEFTFDASDTDWTDGLALLLSADPLGKVSRRTPLMVQFNNGKPTPVITRGQGFDARIKLDKARIRPFNNKIRFTYNTPAGEECLKPEHGGWRLDFKNSMVIINARAKARNFEIRDVEARLSNPTTAPKSVRILARGNDTAKLQALAAQGMGLRMTQIPEFKTSSGPGEFDIVLGRRDQLHGLISDAKILDGSGARIYVHKGRPMRLIITGDTDIEVMETAKSFATYQLPDAHRAVTSAGELHMQSALSSNLNRVQGTEKLGDLGLGYFGSGWGPKPQTLTFDVSDPVASKGEVLLRIASDKVISDNSRVSVDLNGKSLGFTTLNKSRKSVAFKIPAGTLRGTDNVLSVTPELEMTRVSGCNYTQNLPGFYLGEGSKLKIETPIASPVAELSKMTATGAPFSIEQGRDTVIMLPASSPRDYNGSLKVLAKLAQSSGQGWTHADYMRSTNLAALSADKNVLIIGPSASFGKAISSGAPKGLTSALKGQTLNGSGRMASIDRFAANGEAAALRLYAERQAQAGRIRNGGVAALYPSPLGGGKVMGVITNVPGRSFSSVASELIQPQAWNAVEGSVARWNGSKVIMAQTAMAVPGFIGSAPEQPSFNGIKLPNFDYPKFDKSAFEFGEIDMSSVRGKLENLKLGAASLLAGKTKNKVVAPKVISPRVKPVMTPVPQLRGLSETQPSPKSSSAAIAGLKIWASNASARTKRAWEKLDLSGAIKSLQTRAKSSSGNTAGSKVAAWSKELMNTPAIMLALAMAAFFLLLGLLVPTTHRRG